MKVFVTGATGYIGQALCRALSARGDAVRALSRRSGPAIEGALRVVGDPVKPGSWAESLADCDAVVHLAGVGVADRRWDADHKAAIRDTRVRSAQNLVRAIGELPEARRPKVLVTASGIDVYPWDESDKAYDESSPVGDSFLADVCRQWEAAAEQASRHDVRVVAVRTPLVVGPNGGPLAKMAVPFKAFVGGPLGSGQQWQSWIHLDDIVAVYLLAIDRESMRGPLNACAPGSVRQREFAAALGRALDRPAWMPAPAFALRLALGEFAEVNLHGRRAVPGLLNRGGFEHRYPSLDLALRASFPAD